VAQGRGLTRATWRVVRTPQAAHALNLSLHQLQESLSLAELAAGLLINSDKQLVFGQKACQRTLAF
jgi:hypothetical protein